MRFQIALILIHTTIDLLQIARTISETRDAVRQLAKPVGFVPTMGALHAGHLSLIERARQQSKSVVVSIFVNPTQFAPQEDYQNYPRPIEDDLRLCEKSGVGLVFAPSAGEMYPSDAPSIHVEPLRLAQMLEGVHRPTHFAGVCQVVAKLFNIVAPQAAFFGEKDFQQFTIIRAMASGLNFPVEIVGCPTVRDPDGLALSSRNRFLSPAERTRALAISRSLRQVVDQYRQGKTNADTLRQSMRQTLLTSHENIPIELHYATIVDRMTLEELKAIDRPAQALVAMKVGRTRLIDNMALE